MTGVAVAIRPERSSDATAIRAVHDAAFGGPEEGRIVDAVRSEPWFEPELSLVAEVAGSIVGHCLVSVCRVESAVSAPVGSVLALGPIAVAPDHQGRGIGGALVRAVHGVARARDFPAVVLLGHPGYYPRFGYVSARLLGLEPPAPWPDEAWQALALAPLDAIPRGIVRYPGAFEPL